MTAQCEEIQVRADPVPRRFVARGEWPYAELVADAPLAAHYGQEVARRLKEAMALRGWNHRTVGERAGLAHRTVGRVLAGESYPDLATLARLEAAVRADLYPTGLYWHRQNPRT